MTVHLKLILGQPNSKVTIDAIGFNMIDKLEIIQSKLPIEVLYTLESNIWRDLETLQLNIKDIRAMI
jgi:single-stranded-DNA-specific exonuclease